MTNLADPIEYLEEAKLAFMGVVTPISRGEEGD